MNLRIVFMGSPKCVIPVLEAMGSQVVAVVGQPARPSGRNRVLTHPPLVEWAKAHLSLCPIFQPENAKDPHFISELSRLGPDLIVTASYGQILSDDFLKIPSRGTINLHPSLLPRHRGATPVQQALLDQDQMTGMTILFTVKKMDAGNIILQREYPLNGTERSGGLLDDLFKLGAQMLPEALHLLEDSNYQGTPQDESKVTHCRKFSKADGQLDFRKHARDLFSEHRAFDPWPGTYTFLLDGTRVLVTQVEGFAQRVETVELGQAIIVGHSVWIQCAHQSFLKIAKVKPEGGKEVDAFAFTRSKGGLCFKSM